MSLFDTRKTELKEHDLPGTAPSKWAGPVRGVLGISFFLLHLFICAYIVLGWLVPSTSALVFYLVFLPLVAMLWLVNRGARVISNLETRAHTHRWRDPNSARDDRFISSSAFSLLGVSASPANIDILIFGSLFVLWLLGFTHLSLLGDPALLSLFP